LHQRAAAFAVNPPPGWIKIVTRRAAIFAGPPRQARAKAYFGNLNDNTRQPGSFLVGAWRPSLGPGMVLGNCCTPFKARGKPRRQVDNDTSGTNARGYVNSAAVSQRLANRFFLGIPVEICGAQTFLQWLAVLPHQAYI
jgi:hypothetical protein